MPNRTHRIYYKDKLDRAVVSNGNATGNDRDAQTTNAGGIIMCEKIIRAKQAAELIGIAESTFWRWVSEGRIPQGTRLSKRATVWKYTDVQNFLTRMDEVQA